MQQVCGVGAEIAIAAGASTPTNIQTIVILAINRCISGDVAQAPRPLKVESVLASIGYAGEERNRTAPTSMVSTNGT